MARSVAEWKGKTADTKIPPRVKERVFDRHDGKCHICDLPIKVPFESWDADHVIALKNGGENRESNLKPAHKHCHIAKTAKDVAEKSKVAAIRQKHIGIERTKPKIQSPGFQKFQKPKRIEKRSLPPVSLYREVKAHDH